MINFNAAKLANAVIIIIKMTAVKPTEKDEYDVTGRSGAAVTQHIHIERCFQKVGN
jgi:hypothetical protein